MLVIIAPMATTMEPQRTEDGVIEQARRRQRRRRARGALAIALAGAIAALGWLLGGRSSGASVHSHPPYGVRVVGTETIYAPAFNVRLVPMTSIGQAGWCEVFEDHGVSGASACGSVPSSSEPFTMIFGFGKGGASEQRTIAVTIPQVAAIEVNGKRRVVPVSVPGLPYGLRAAQIVTSTHEHLPRAMREAMRRAGPVLVALDAQGHTIPSGPQESQRQARVRSWHAPGRPPAGSCRLGVDGLTQLVAQSGEVASEIRPFAGQLVGQAFLACAETLYVMHGMPVRAFIMLNAGDPSAPVAALPNFKPVAHAAGFFAEGGLTATRAGNVWLLVRQGRDLGQRIEVLRHLTATVRL